MGTSVEILLRKNKTSTVRTTKNMGSPLNTVIARRSMGKNSRTTTRRATKKISAVRNKKKNEKKKRQI